MSIRKQLACVLCLAVASFTTPAPAADIVDTAVGAGNFNTLVAAVKAGDLVDTLKGEGPFTVFAPTDEAFAAIPKEQLEALLQPSAKKKLQGILLYHVAPGKLESGAVVKAKNIATANGQRADVSAANGEVKVDNAKVVATDIQCDNGIIHVIDAVILPESKSIPEVAQAAGSFNTLLAAAKAAGLVGALSGQDDLTVFAPTDDAFAALPAGTVESLLKPENKAKLAAVLTYHVVPGRVYSDQALKAGSAKTLQGGEVAIKVDGDAAMVNDAKLLKTDIDASNGVIHVIDKVILPPSEGTSSVSPKQQIEQVIAEGSRLYNDGHAASCAELYHETMQTVLASPDHGLCTETVSHIQNVMTEVEHTQCMNTRAWKLRRGLEVAYSRMD